MENAQPPITPPPMNPLPQPQPQPQQATAQGYVCIAFIQWYPVAKHPAETLPQSLPIARTWSPQSPLSTGQHFSPPGALYARPLNIPPSTAPRYRARKARDREPQVAEALLGCTLSLVIGILMLMFLYYLSAAR